MKKAVYKLNLPCGRQGDLEGVFIAPIEYVKYLLDNNIEIYFGEVLGKHSEVSKIIKEHEIKFITDDENVVKIMLEHDLTSGFNPFEYTSYKCGEEFVDLCVGEIIGHKLAGTIPEN